MRSPSFHTSPLFNPQQPYIYHSTPLSLSLSLSLSEILESSSHCNPQTREMAVSSKGRTELPFTKKWKEREETSPERTKVWTEPKPKKIERKVAVVYYLCRNGHLEHPHFMEVPLSSTDGLYLRDVLNRLNFLRGKGLASMYSWSSKRSYKNGFVWHDLSENDFIYPAHGQEYVLKGSELLEASRSSGSQDTVSSSSNSDKPLELPKSDDSDFPIIRRRNQSWSSLDLNEYKVYKAESTAEIAGKAADASTQTDDKRRRRRAIREEQEQEEEEQIPAVEENPTTELSREEISPPQSSPSPETLESLIKADRRALNAPISIEEAEVDRDRTLNSNQGGKVKASAVLMQLISCGSISVKDHGFSLISHYRGRLPRGAPNRVVSKEMDGLMENPGFGGLRLEDKEYFSGSLIETKKGREDGVAEFSGLKRSSSYNADRCSKLDLIEKEIDGVRAKCIPRKPKTPAKKETDTISRSVPGSKRTSGEPVK
ncbi:protein SOSEKI 5 isoform X2 [Magnolia sinica]|uniref:protein SOSEKI 5 isoform X2 n=1 Tax=Magnolia sinica TaxID=86752 RepID=UPI002657D878|nr:protein SOSEKI 5 isoform X2 [Magnolia sinica]